MAQSFSFSRRSFVLGGLALAGGAGGLFVVERAGQGNRQEVSHRAGSPASSPPHPDVLTALTAYLGAYFGRSLSEQDKAELADRMTFAALRDKGWADEYAAAAGLLDASASDHGHARFAAASRDVQVAVVQDLLQPVRGPLAELRLGMSGSAWARERMRVSTSRHLVRLYRNSGVPWRQHGFSTWPGVPDQVSAYDRLKSA